MNNYQVVNGTAYHAETSKTIIDVLESVRENRTRILVEYGDTKTGKGWGDTNDVAGYVGRSTGLYKIPLLIFNSRSFGGPSMLDHCIVSIQESKGKRFLYKHPTYTTGRNEQLKEVEQSERQSMEHQVEAIIDSIGVGMLLNHIANVCFEKAQHVRQFADSDNLAKAWEKNGQKIARIILTD